MDSPNLRTSERRVAAVLEFVAAINRGDVEALGALMTDDHELKVLDEAPLVGRDANIEAWHGYASSFPRYVIAPHEIVEQDGRVAVLGHTTGSHLMLDDEAERKLTVIWVAEVVDGRLRSWHIVEDTAASRAALGLGR